MKNTFVRKSIGFDSQSLIKALLREEADISNR